MCLVSQKRRDAVLRAIVTALAGVLRKRAAMRTAEPNARLSAYTKHRATPASRTANQFANHAALIVQTQNAVTRAPTGKTNA